MEWCNEVKEIEQIGLPDLGRLTADYVLPGKPAVIRDALRGTGLESWSPGYLKERVGTTRVRVTHGRAEDEDKTARLRTYESTVAQFIDETVMTASTDSAASPYLQQTSIPALFPELVADIPVAKFIRPELVTALNLWLGPPNTVSPLHYDGGNNFLMQVYGEKRIILFETQQTPVLYPNEPGRRSRAHVSAADISRPDFGAHPKLREATPTVVHLTPGDVLVIPSCCWHEVHGLSPSISINIWWRPLDEQLLTPAYTRLIPGYFYERPPNFFHRSIQYRFDSFADYARALGSMGENRTSALCYLMLLERYLELRGQQHAMTFEDVKGLDAPAKLARRLFEADALSRDELALIDGWLAVGRRLLSFEPTEDAECRALQEAIGTFVGVADLEPPPGRIRFEDLVSA